MLVPDRSHALDHIVVVLFENRSFDNVLGHLYGPGDGKNFDGVMSKDLSNPIPGWAEHDADRKVVPYTVATDMDSPNPGSRSARGRRLRGTRRHPGQHRRWTGS
jgi:phospholipase C